MKLNRTADKFVFQLGKQEKHLLLELLKLYPCVPPAHLRLSRSGRVPEPDSSQKLLEEALSEQRVENKQQVQAFLADSGRFAETESGCRLTLSAPEVEWFLQVLNDIRVGSWVSLGSPEPLELATLNTDTAPRFWAMEMAGYFQMHFLEAFQSSQ